MPSMSTGNNALKVFRITTSSGEFFVADIETEQQARDTFTQYCDEEILRVSETTYAELFTKVFTNYEI